LAIVEDPPLLYKIFFWIHKVLTTWYISEILLFMFVLFGFLLLYIVLRHSKVYLFLIKDKYNFAKHYLYFFFRAKINFIKDWTYIIQQEYRKFIIIFGIIALILIMIVWIFLSIVPETPKPF